MSIDNKGVQHTKLYKELGAPQALYASHPHAFEGNGEIKDWGLDVLIGHNRYATQGEITAESAHPFDFEHVVGAHNGTVSQFSMKDFADAGKFKIDSQMIYSQINADNDLQKVWDKADGAMALTWWDRRDQRLHVARNDERTLYFCYSEDESCVFWASESWMLTVALNRHGLKHKEIKMFEKDRHYTFSVEFKQVQQWDTPLNPFVKPIKAIGFDNWDEWEDRYGAGSYGGSYKSPTRCSVIIKEFTHTGTEKHEGDFWGISLLDENEIRINTVSANQKEYYDLLMGLLAKGKNVFWYSPYSAYKMNGYLTLHVSQLALKPVGDILGTTSFNNGVEVFKGIGPYDADLTKRQWLAATSCGCDLCNTPLIWAERDKVLWVGDSPICPECANSDVVKDWVESESVVE